MQGMGGILGEQTLTLGASDTESSVYDALKYGPIAALLMPATFTDTTLTFLIATREEGTYRQFYVDGEVYSLTVAVDQWVWIDPVIFNACPYVKIVVSSGEGTNREIIVIGRKT